MTFSCLRFAFIALFLLCPQIHADTLPQPNISNAVFAAINAARFRNGIAALEYDNEMQRLADEWANYLITTGDFRHRDSLSDLARERRLRLVTENVWQSAQPVPAETIVNDWLDSPGHAANLLSDASRIGAAAVRVAADGRTVAVFQGGAR